MSDKKEINTETKEDIKQSVETDLEKDIQEDAKVDVKDDVVKDKKEEIKSQAKEKFQLYKGLFLVHYNEFVSFLKKAKTEGVVPTLKSDKKNTGILGGLAVLLILILTVTFSSEENVVRKQVVAESSKPQFLEAQFTNKGYPYGVISYTNAFGTKLYREIGTDKISEFMAGNLEGERFELFSAPFSKISKASYNQTDGIKLKEIHDAYIFKITKPTNGEKLNVVILKNFKNSGEVAYWMAEYPIGGNPRDSVMNMITFE